MYTNTSTSGVSSHASKSVSGSMQLPLMQPSISVSLRISMTWCIFSVMVIPHS